MANNRTGMLGWIVALSAGIVVAAVYAFGGGAAKPAAEADKPAGAVLAASGGVRPAEVDPARRIDLDPRAGDEPRLPEIRPAAATPEQDRRDGETPPQPPPPPMEISEQQRAAEAAHNALRVKVAAAVGKQLGSQRGALAKACWKDHGAASGADFAVNASFDAAGKLLAMGISDKRGPNSDAAAGVGQCLRQQAIALSVEAPGEGVTVDVPLHLP